ncbi:MAG: efflux RND transporter permease subunit, partial [bacterium]|nr:efflux RND transporter permease subunit [bacterium]
LVLIITLAVSLVEAFLILPSHMAHSLEHTDPSASNRFRTAFERGFEWTRDRAFGPLIDWAVSWRYLFSGILVGLLLISLSLVLSGTVKLAVFPDTEGDTIEARILLPQGTPLSYSEAIVQRLADSLKKVDDKFSSLQPQGRRLVQNTMVQYATNVDSHESGPHVATVTADLLTAELRRGKVDDFLQYWREETGDIADVITVNFTELTGNPAGAAIDMRLQGPDLVQLKAASLDLQNHLNSYDGVLDLSDDLRPGKLEMRLKLKEGALALGFDASSIANQLRASYFGSTAGEIQVGRESYEVDVRLDIGDRSSLADLERFTLAAPDGPNIPLSAVAKLETGRG